MCKESDPCYKCERRQVTSTYNCHSHCPEYKKWADKIASENELVRRKKAVEADVNSVRIKSIRKSQREKEAQKCRWKG